MNAQNFLRALEKYVRDPSLVTSIENLSVGRFSVKGSKQEARSSWYNSLTESEKEIFSDCMAYAIDTALFNFLCVLDGVNIIEDDNDRGGFDLVHKGVEKNIINHEEVMLHEEFIRLDEK